VKIVTLLTDLFDATGGIQTYNRSLVHALDQIAAERDLVVTNLVLNDRGGSGLAEKYLDANRTTYLPFSRRKSAFAFAALREALDASAVVVGHVNFAPLVLGFQLLRPRLRTVLAIYGIDVWTRVPFLQRQGARRAKMVLSISASTRDRAVAANHLDSSKITVIPCTLDPFYGNGQRISSRSDLSLPDGPMILAVSRLSDTERYKRIDLLLQALKIVALRIPDAYCVIVGDGAYRAGLQAMARNLGVKDRVIFPGRVSDEVLPSYYGAADLFALPSLKEGFGIVFLEAMYYSKPCIGVRAGGVPEVVADGKTGYVTAPDDPEALAGSIINLLANESLREDMGRAGKKRLQQEFSNEAFRRRLEAALCERIPAADDPALLRSDETIDD
jgi:glycosyltransferase involved in cell wall biosynthesis